VNVTIVATLVMACVAMIVAVTSALIGVYKRGQNEGRLTEILSQLTAMSADHEARLRTLEKSRVP
jgi:hypothetical protein